MTELDLRDDIKFAYHDGLAYDEQGVIPQRFPEPVVQTFQPHNMQKIARMQSGVELQIAPGITKVSATFDLLDTDNYGIIGEWYAGPLRLLPVVFFDPGKKEHTCSVEIMEYTLQYPVRFLFPTHCTLRLKSVQTDKKAAGNDFEPFSFAEQKADGRKLTWVVHGDSITQGANVSIPSMTWVNQVARMLKIKAVNLGIGGYGCAEPELGAYLATRKDADIMSIHIGTNLCGNAREKDLTPQLVKYIETIHAGVPNTPLVIVSPILTTTRDVTAIREQWRKAVNELHGEGITNCQLVSGDTIMNDEHGLIFDGIHVGDWGQAIYAANFAPALRKHMNR